MKKGINKLHGLARVLVFEELLSETEAINYQTEAKQQNKSLVSYLVDQKILEPLKIAQIAANDFGVPLFDINMMEKETIPSSLVSEKLIRRHQAIPLFKRGEHLYIAIDDPSKQTSLKEVQFHTGLITHPIIVESQKLTRFIDDVFSEPDSDSLGDFLEDTSDLDSLEISAEEEETEEQDDGTDDAPVVRFVHKILLDSIKRGASDLHFEPYEKSYRIRFRIDGMLTEIANPPLNLASRITARIKVMSNLDISERRIPQDGRFKLKISRSKAIDFRISTCPTVGGEKVVMRILDPNSTKLGIDALGFSKAQRKLFSKVVEQPQGMLLVTGPTGSGKTVTLYTALNQLNRPEKNISTAEDPVEIKLTGVNQVNINPKSGLTFPSALRSFLRQDPDIIMIGEIRDLETAEIGIKAAQTGHFVLSTLHTNSSAETLTRMLNMGVPAFNIASSVSLIIAQRLARRLCENCKKPQNDLPEETLLDEGFSKEQIANCQLMRPVGCEHCAAGYKGRIGLFEVMHVSKELGSLIMEGGSSIELEKLARSQGMITIRESGLEKVQSGMTSLAEVNRVTVA